MKVKNVIYFLGIVFSVICFVYFIYYLKNNFSDIPTIKVNSYTYFYFIFAFCLSFLPNLLGGFSWHLLLSYTQESIPIKHSLIIFTTSQFGKYLPGNFGHHIGRVAIATSYGLKISRVLFTMVIEFYLSLMSAFILAIIALTIIKKPLISFIPIFFPNILKFIIVSFCCFIFLIFCAWLFKKKVNLHFNNILDTKEISMPNKAILLNNIILYLLGFVSIGIVIDLLAVGIFNAPQMNICLLTSIFSVAWISGFVTPGAPAGLGVRETVLVTLLEPLYGSGIALGVSAFLRIITTSSDGLTFLIALAVKNSALIFNPRN